PVSQNNKSKFTDAFSVPEPAPILFKVQCLFDFAPNRPDDLGLSADDVVEIEKEDGDWLYGFKSEKPSEKGWFPRNFTEPYEPNKKKAEKPAVVPAAVAAHDPIGVALALYDYAPLRDDELALSAGQSVTIFDKSGGAWWDVMNDFGARGLVPASYVQEESAESASVVPPPPEKEYSLRVSTNSSFGGHDAFLSANVPSMSRGSASQGAVSSEGFQHWVSVVNPALMAQLSTEERKRQEAIFELIQTEFHYLRDLQLIVEVFYQPLGQFLSDTEISSIFSNIEDILMVNTVIFSDFESAQIGSQYVVNNIGELFQKHADALNCYATYCGNQGVASRMLQKKRSEIPALQDFLKNCQRNPRCRSLDLSSFLLQPMQRITRYIILLKQILHYTPPEHQEYESILRAVDMADRVAERVNVAVMAVESRDKLEAIEAQVDFAGSDFMRVDITGPSTYGGPRGYLFESALSKSKSGKKLYGYMLSDMILLVQPQSSGLGLFKNSNFAYVMYHAPILIHQATLRDVPRAMIGTKDVGNVDETTFQIVQGDEVITLKAPSASIKNKWLTHHENALRALR
ncbi:hypothetical protein HK100_003680, partial [Physocladia obscura]